jgi:hypothetical protein
LELKKGIEVKVQPAGEKGLGSKLQISLTTKADVCLSFLHLFFHGFAPIENYLQKVLIGGPPVTLH